MIPLNINPRILNEIHKHLESKSQRTGPRAERLGELVINLVPHNTETMTFKATLLEIHKAGETRLGDWDTWTERKTNQISNPFASDSMLPGCDPIFWSSNSKLLFLIHGELDTQRLMAISLEIIRTCWKICPPTWPSTQVRSKQFPSELPAHPPPHQEIPRNIPLTFLLRGPMCTKKWKEVYGSVKWMQKWQYKYILANLTFSLLKNQVTIKINNSLF